MAKRKSISKLIRFEVFKRDSFKCQYCGQSAPDVLLELDHIKPVKNGGTSDIINLITACRACNAGKGARELDDRAVIDKQKKQLEELNERREQLAMMIEWRDSMKDIIYEELKYAKKEYERYFNYSLTDYGSDILLGLLRQFGVSMVLDAMEITARHKEVKKDGWLKYIAGICWQKTRNKT